METANPAENEQSTLPGIAPGTLAAELPPSPLATDAPAPPAAAPAGAESVANNDNQPLPDATPDLLEDRPAPEEGPVTTGMVPSSNMDTATKALIQQANAGASADTQTGHNGAAVSSLMPGGTDTDQPSALPSPANPTTGPASLPQDSAEVAGQPGQANAGQGPLAGQIRATPAGDTNMPLAGTPEGTPSPDKAGQTAPGLAASGLAASGLATLNLAEAKTARPDANLPQSGAATPANNTTEGANLPSTSENENATSRQNSSENPASLMQRLKALQQGNPLPQAMAGMAENDAKIPALAGAGTGITPGLEGVRPAAIEGLVPGTGNQGSQSVPLNNIAVHIAAQARAGNQKFSIRLDPPELGRIDIRLEVGRDGQALTHMAVEKPETLELLRQDSRALERALANAGLDSQKGNLSFSLRDDNSARQQANNTDDDNNPPAGDNTQESQESDEPVTRHTVNVSSGIDISI